MAGATARAEEVNLLPNPAVEISPPAEGVRVGAMLSPAGKLSILAVNRYDRAIQVQLSTGLGRESKLMIYRFTRAALAAATGQMLEASGNYRPGRLAGQP